MIQADSVTKHYDKYAKLYEYWSGTNGGGYHFGFANNFWEMFDNEKMTKNMTELIIQKSMIDYRSPQAILDAGCGAGHLARAVARKVENKDFKIRGITISEKQLELGVELDKKEGLEKIISLTLGNFEQTEFEDNSFDVIFFVDSICHGSNADKSKAINEASRILKSNGVVIISDGFLEKESKKLGFWERYFNRKVCNVFDVEKWAEKRVFFQEMEKAGFIGLESKDLSFKIAPSVLHALFCKLPGSIWNYIKGDGEAFQIKYFFIAGIFSPLLGMMPSFKYRLVTARKSGNHS